MTIELWDVGWHSRIVLPTAPLGYLIFAIYLVLLAIAFRPSKARHPSQSTAPARRLITAVLILGPILTLALIPIPSGSASESIGFFDQTGILSAIPWMLAGGFLGTLEAGAVGLLSGLVMMFFGTGTLITPLHMACLATFTSWSMRNSYQGRLGDLMRRPIFSALVGGLIFGLLSGVEAYAFLEGDAIQNMERITSGLGIDFSLALVPLGIAGVVAEISKVRFARDWYIPTRLRPLPFQRSLSGKLLGLIIGFGAFGGLVSLVMIWVTVRSNTLKQFENQTTQRATELSQTIPYFIQTGRSLIRGYALELAEEFDDPEQLTVELEKREMLVAYFSGLAIFTQDQTVAAAVPQSGLPVEGSSTELANGLSIALTGVPNEVVLGSSSSNDPVQQIFLVPIADPDTENIRGVLAGWTGLQSNPLLLALNDRLDNATPAQLSILDHQGRILMSSDRSDLYDFANLGGLSEGFQSSEEGGEARISHLFSVPGYPWYILTSIPRSEIDRLAFGLSISLFSTIAILGVSAIVAVYLMSKRLTRPLEEIADVADSVARGNLEKQIFGHSEDEIGRLAGSFERMRATIHSRINEMDLLLAVSQRVASSLDLSQFLPPILDGIRGLTNADLVRLVIAPDSETSDETLEGFQIGEALEGWTNLDHQILALCKSRGYFILENPNRARALLDLDAVGERISSLVAFPILNKDDFVGCLWIGHRDPYEFTHHDENLITIISGHLGVAVANARLYHQGEEERARLNAVLQAIPDAVIVTDPSGLIKMANQAAEVALNTSASRAKNQPAADVINIPELLNLMLDDSREPRTSEIQVEGDRSYFVSITGKGNSKAPTGKICVLWDVTQFRELDALKSAFVSSVSHDLRVPLTLMNGYVNMLSRVGALNDQQKDFIRKISGASEQMTHLVDNVLDLGRLESGQPLKLEEIEIKSVIEEALDMYKPQALNRQIHLELEIQPGMVKIGADPTLVRQAIGNLVDNAIRFSSAEDRIKINAYQERGFQVIEVQDEGIGIAPADQSRLFERFNRAQTKDSEGPGLGLSIAKSIVKQHGGRIEVESKLGEGSTFTLELPITPKPWRKKRP